AAERSAWLADEIYFIENVEEAVHGKRAAVRALACQRRVTRAGQAEAAARLDPQQVEVRIAGDLTLDREHFGVEARDRVVRRARTHLGHTVRRQRDIASISLQLARALEMDLQSRAEGFLAAVGRIARREREAIVRSARTRSRYLSLADEVRVNHRHVNYSA